MLQNNYERQKQWKNAIKNQLSERTEEKTDISKMTQYKNRTKSKKFKENREKNDIDQQICVT